MFRISLGTAVAAEVAAEEHPAALLILSPYTSLRDVVRALLWRAWLAPLVWYEFPTAHYVSSLKNRCLIVAHGESDKLIPYEHSRKLLSDYHGQEYSELILNPKSDHNSLFFEIKPEMEQSLAQCFSDRK